MTSAAQPYRSALRISGTLSRNAQRAHTAGSQTLLLHLQPPEGLPYVAHVHLHGAADCAAGDSLMPLLRQGAVVSLGGDALALHGSQGSHHLQVLGARDCVVFLQPVPVPAPDTFALEG